MNKKSFKIIAIKPLNKCSNKHLKVLRRNTIYYFYQDYSIKHLRVENETISYKDSYPFDLYKKGRININVSAVVGGNGSGKSTIVELLFKAINNIAFNFKEKVGNNNKTIISDLKEVKGVHVDLYFEKNEQIFKINVSNSKFKVFEFKGYPDKILENEPINDFNLSHLFYTEVINYSHYAYNSIYEGDWIQSLFHKNDSYQTPVVFNPMRTFGNTDINVENDLVKQRLIANLLNPPISKTDLDFRKIGDNLTGYGVRLKLKPEKHEVLYDVKLNKRFDLKKYIKPKKRTEILIRIYEFFYNVNGVRRDTFLVDNDIYKRIESYIVYKLISITYKYSEYKIYFLKNERDFDYKILEKYFFDLKEDKSHITFKLKQTLNYLHFNHFVYNKGKTIKLDFLSNQIKKIINRDNSNAIIELIPPPIFDVEILLKTNVNNEIVLFSMLSSGEKQLIYSVNSLLYHLKNLDSVSDNKIQYKDINIVFEEIELYFHPNLQRKFIDILLKSIDRIGLKSITSLNIIFITHSPFILSDIPSNNVMFLKVIDGRTIQENKKQNTFGANIHELISSNFFFDEGHFIGEFARTKINSVIKEINICKANKLTKKRFIYLNSFISTIDENIIRAKLREMLYEKRPKKEQQGWIDEEIKHLRNLKHRNIKNGLH